MVSKKLTIHSLEDPEHPNIHLSKQNSEALFFSKIPLDVRSAFYYLYRFLSA